MKQNFKNISDSIQALNYLSFGINNIIESKDKNFIKNNIKLKSLNTIFNKNYVDPKYSNLFIDLKNNLRNYFSHAKDDQNFINSKSRFLELIDIFLNYYPEIQQYLISINKNYLYDRIQEIIFEIKIEVDNKENEKVTNYQKEVLIDLLILISTSFFMHKHELKKMIKNYDYQIIKKYKLNDEQNTNIVTPFLNKIIDILKEISENESINHSEINEIYWSKISIWNLIVKIKKMTNHDDFSIKEIFYILETLLEENGKTKIKYYSSKNNFYEQYRLKIINKDAEITILDYEKLQKENDIINFIKMNDNQFKLMFYSDNKKMNKEWIKKITSQIDPIILDGKKIFFDKYENQKSKWFTIAFNKKNIFLIINKILEKGMNYENFKKELRQIESQRKSQTIKLFIKTIEKNETLYKNPNNKKAKNKKRYKGNEQEYLKKLIKLVLSEVIKLIKKDSEINNDKEKIKKIYDDAYFEFYNSVEKNIAKRIIFILENIAHKINENINLKEYINNLKNKNDKKIYDYLIKKRREEKQKFLLNKNIIYKSLLSNFIYFAFEGKQKENLEFDEEKIYELLLNRMTNQENQDIHYDEKEEILVLGKQQNLAIKNITLPVNLYQIESITNVFLNNKEQNEKFLNDKWKYEMHFSKSLSNSGIMYLNDYKWEDEPEKAKIINFTDKLNDLLPFIEIIKDKRNQQEYKDDLNLFFHSRFLTDKLQKLYFEINKNKKQ